MSIRTNLVGTIVLGAALLVPVAQADDWARDVDPGALTPTVVVESTSSGFDWSDAAIGMVGGIGVTLLLTGALFLLLSPRGRARTV